MISIIICSASTELLNNVKANIEQTIGVTHEILIYENSSRQKGICEVYNQGVRDAKYNILCFMHEDVEIHTPIWGLNVLRSFEQNARLGLLGIAGSSYKSLSPSGWLGSEFPPKIKYINLLQRYKYSPKAEEVKYNNASLSPLVNVAAIDGVWFCGKKDILKSYPFDQTLLQKFHGYDIDISLSLGIHFDVCVTFNVMLTHFSEGNFGKDWIETTLLLHEKWGAILPLNKASLSEHEMWICEKNAFKSFINTMRKANYSSYSCLKVLNQSGIRSRFGILLYLRLVIKCLSA